MSDILAAAEALLLKTEPKGSIREVFVAKAEQHEPLRQMIRSLLDYHYGYRKSNQRISGKAIGIATLFYETKPGEWALKPETSRHYRAELAALLEEAKGFHE